jgi:hypothetical protein
MTEQLDPSLFPDQPTTGTVIMSPEMFPDKPSKIEAAYRAGLQVDPDHAAKVIRYSGMLGQSPSEVDKNPVMAEKVAAAHDSQYWADFEKNHPAASRHFVNNPDHVVAAQDDFENIGATEKAVKDAGFWHSMYRASMSGLGSLNANIARIPGLAYDTAAIPQNLLMKAIGKPELQVKSPDWLTENPVTKYYDEGAKSYHVDAIDKGIFDSIKAGNYADAGKSLALQFAQNAPNQAALIVSALTGFGTAGLVGAGLTTAADSQRQGKDSGADPAMNTLNSLTKGTIESGFESLGTFGLLKSWEHAIAQSVGKQSSREVMKEVAKTLVHSAAGEGNEEFLTSIAQDFSDHITGVKPDALDGMLTRAIDAGIVGGMSGAAMTGPGAIASGSHKALATRRIEKLKEVYNTVGQTVKESKLRGRLPEAHASLVGTIAEGTPVENVYLPVDAAETYFQSKNIPIEKVVQDLGVEKQYQDAKARGGDIVIPFSKWVSQMADTEHYNALADDVKFSAEEFTPNQEKQVNSHLDTLMQSEVAKAKVETEKDAKVRAGYDSVYEYVKQAQEQAGKPAAMNQKQWTTLVESNARLSAAHAVAQSVRRGISVEEYFSGANKPQIVKGDGPIAPVISINKSQYKSEVLDRIKSEVEAGYHESGGFVPQANQETLQAGEATNKSIPSYSTYPKYMQNKGHTKAEVLNILDKTMGGAKLTEKQQTILDDLYQSSGYDQAAVTKEEPFLQSPVSKQPAPEFYSKLEKTVQDKVSNNATPAQIIATLREVKPEEMQYSGINEFLQGKEKVSKQELLDFLKENQIQVEEVKKIDPKASMDKWKAAGGTGMRTSAADAKFTQYTLPGGENYREILFTLPPVTIAELPDGYVVKQNPATETAKKYGSQWVVEGPTSVNGVDQRYGHGKTQAEAIADFYSKHGSSPVYRSGHWEEKNVLAHVRLDDRVDSDGKHVLFVEEIQSDWHQDGRKKGYKGQSESSSLPPNASVVLASDGNYVVQNDGFKDLDSRASTESESIRLFNKKRSLGVPDAPFKKTWHEFALKKILRMAAENGYDRVAWTTGDQQAARYDLSKQVDRVSMQRLVTDGKENGQVAVRATKDGNDVLDSNSIVPESKVPDLFGKEVYQKLKEQADKGTNVSAQLEGNDLKIGGDGMKGFYDKIIPDFLSKYTKKWGGRVGETSFVKPETTLSYAESQRRRNGGEVDPAQFKQTVHSIDVTPQMRDAVLFEGQTLFQDGETPRGSVNFGKDSTIISMFRNADASTFVHESAHMWLKDLNDHIKSGKADAQYLADWKVLSDWLAIKDGQEKLTTEQQETFARGFEAYVMEGKAPTSELRKVFANFKRWLTKIYSTVKGLNVELSDPVRGVMDRMLSAESEINQAEKVSGGMDNTQIEGMPAEAAKKLSDLREQAHEEAVSTLLTRQMDEISKDNLAKITKAKEDLTRRATENVKSVPVYKSQNEIQDNLKADPKESAQKYIDGKLTEENGIRFDMIAEANGYTSGDEMAKTILKAQKVESYIADRVEMGMIEFEDLKDSSRIKEAALEAIHSDKQVEVMAMEKAVLDGMVENLPDAEAAKKRRAIQAKVEYDAAKALAAKIIGSSRVGDAVAFKPYFTAERNEAVQVARALVKKDYKTAADHKQKQMLNHALAMESLKVKKMVDKEIDFLKAIQKKKASLFKAEEHFTQVAMILERFGMPRYDFNKELRRETLKDWVIRMNDEESGVGNAVLPEWIMDETVRTKIADLSIDQLHDVVDSIKNIQTAANVEKRFLSIMDGADIDQIVDRLTDESNLNTKESEKTKHSAEPGKLDAIAKMWASYKTSLKKISTILRKQDGWKDFGIWQQVFTDPVYQAANVESDMLKKAEGMLEKLWSAYSKKELNEMGSKLIHLEELGTSATKMRLIAMALNMGNQGNRDRLFSTPPVWADQSKYWDLNVAKAMLKKNLTVKDWEFVQNAWDMIGTLWPEIAALHKDMTGFTPGKVEHLPFLAQAKDGEVAMRGGYYPLKEDHRSSEKANVREKLEAPLYSEKNPGWIMATKTGHTKGRVEKATYAVALDITLINRHMRDVIHDIAFRKVITDLRRLMNNRFLQDSMKRNVGPEGFEAVKEWVASVATGNVQNRTMLTTMERVVRSLRSNTTTAVLGFKPSVIIQNFANPFLFDGAIEGFGKREAARGFFVRGLMDYFPKVLFNWKAAAETRAFIYEKSSFMRDKHETPDFSFHEQKNTMFGKDSSLAAFGHGLMAATDEMSNVPMWLEAFHKQMDEHGKEDKAVRYADTLVERVTGSSRKYDQAGYQRADEITKSVAMFYSFMNVEANRWMSENGLRKESIKNYPRFLGFVAQRMLVFVPLSALLAGKGPGDKDDPWAWWLKETAMFPLGFLPSVRDLASIGLDQTLGLKSFGYRPSPAISGIEAGLRVGQTAIKATQGKAGTQEVAESTTKAMSYLLPYPDQLNQWFWNVYDMTSNGMSPEVQDFYKRRPKKDRH